MNRILIGCVALLATILAGNPVDAAKPNWDLDYELWVGQDIPAWQLWYQEPGQSPKVFGTFNSLKEANLWLFKSVEHSLHQPGTSYWVVETTQIQWTYINTFEHYADANQAAGWFASIGLHTDIRSVFGGYYLDDLLTPLRYSSQSLIRVLLSE